MGRLYVAILSTLFIHQIKSIRLQPDEFQRRNGFMHHFQEMAKDIQENPISAIGEENGFSEEKSAELKLDRP